jgi:hypothetical protein
LHTLQNTRNNRLSFHFLHIECRLYTTTLKHGWGRFDHLQNNPLKTASLVFQRVFKNNVTVFGRFWFSPNVRQRLNSYDPSSCSSAGPNVSSLPTRLVPIGKHCPIVLPVTHLSVRAETTWRRMLLLVLLLLKPASTFSGTTDDDSNQHCFYMMLSRQRRPCLRTKCISNEMQLLRCTSLEIQKTTTSSSNSIFRFDMIELQCQCIATRHTIHQFSWWKFNDVIF